MAITTLEQLSLEELRELDQGGRLWNLYRQACAESMFFFGKALYTSVPPSENLISEKVHLPLTLMLEEVNYGRLMRLLVELPRKHMKSTFATEIRPIHKLIWRVVNGMDPADRFAIMSWSKEMAESFWGGMKRFFQNNEMFQFLYPELIPDFSKADIWNKSQGQVPSRTQLKEPTFSCVAIGTGKAFTDITEDDFINEFNYRSPTAMATAIEGHRLSKNLLDRPDRCPIVTVGNDWGMLDLNHHIRTNEPETAVLSLADTGPNTVEPFNHCRNLTPVVQELIERMPEGEPIWAEKFSKEALGKQLQELGPRIYFCQWKNRPADPDATDFKFEWLHNKKVFLEKGDGKWLGRMVLKFEDDPEPVPMESVNLYLTWDPARGGRTARARNALVLSFMDYKGRAGILREYAKKEDPLKSIDVAIDMVKLWRRWLRSVGVESVLFQDTLAGILKKRIEDRKIFMHVKPIKIPKNMDGKDNRLRQWIGVYAEANQLYYSPGCTEFVNEYCHFGVPDWTRDVLDALAMGTRLWRKASRPGELSAEEMRERMMETVDYGICGYGRTLAGASGATIAAPGGY